MSDQTNSPLLLAKEEDKWPVQLQNVIVVTRTYQEQRAKRRRRVFVASFVLIFMLLWLIWALAVILG